MNAIVPNPGLPEHDIAALRRVLDGTAEARGLPNTAFTSRAFYDLEREKLFQRTWFCIGFGSDVPEPGDVAPVWFGDLSMVLVRGDDRVVRVFHNVCPHRGMRLVREPAKGKRVLACPYHCWTFDKTGKLLRRPHFMGPDDLEGLPEETDPPALDEVHSAMWCDAVLINIDGNAPDFEDYINPFAAVAAPYGDVEQGINTDNLDYTLESNWKLIAENFIDSYHVKWAHKALNDATPMTSYTHEVGGNLCIGRAPVAQNSAGWGGTLPRWDNLTNEGAGTLTYVSLFPNLLVTFTAERYALFHLVPDGPHRTQERLKIYMRPEALDDRHAQARADYIVAYRTLNDEDVGLVEELQQSRRSPAFDGGRFSPHWDRPAHHFAKQVAAAVLA